MDTTFLNFVAQICNLLYRRFVICGARQVLEGGRIRARADCKSAIQQTTSLRYEKSLSEGQGP